MWQTPFRQMKVFEDYAGRAVRLTPEREMHILDHPEMLDLLYHAWW